MTSPQPQPVNPQPFGDLFRFRPRWWWDPAPDWVLRAVDESVLTQLAVISLQYEKSILDEQTKAIDATIAVLQKIR